MNLMVNGCRKGRAVTNLVHRDHLAVPTTCGTALDAECGTLTRLTNASKCRAAEMRSKSLCQTDSCG